MRAPAMLLAVGLAVACSDARPDASREVASPSPLSRAPLSAGPAVGQTLPAFELPDQDGRLRRFDDLRGPSGLVLNFNRSAVW